MIESSPRTRSPIESQGPENFSSVNSFAKTLALRSASCARSTVGRILKSQSAIQVSRVYLGSWKQRPTSRHPENSGKGVVIRGSLVRKIGV